MITKSGLLQIMFTEDLTSHQQNLFAERIVEIEAKSKNSILDASAIFKIAKELGIVKAKITK